MTLDDMRNRITSLLPPWFNDCNPTLDSLINAAAQGAFFINGLYEFAKLQTRINSANDIFLDVIAYDFFGSSLNRAPGLDDDAFRKQILMNLFRERATRQAVLDIIHDTTDVDGSVFEFLNPVDTGAYSAPTIGYGITGGYGSIQHPYEALVYAQRKPTTGYPYISGYGVPYSGYDVASQGEYMSDANIKQQVNDNQIFQAIESVRPLATKLWVNLTGSSTGKPLDQFILDNTNLG